MKTPASRNNQKVTIKEILKWSREARVMKRAGKLSVLRTLKAL